MHIFCAQRPCQQCAIAHTHSLEGTLVGTELLLELALKRTPGSFMFQPWRLMLSGGGITNFSSLCNELKSVETESGIQKATQPLNIKVLIVGNVTLSSFS